MSRLDWLLGRFVWSFGLVGGLVEVEVLFLGLEDLLLKGFPPATYN
jgi:hypothetical protein